MAAPDRPEAPSPLTRPGLRRDVAEPDRLPVPVHRLADLSRRRRAVAVLLGLALALAPLLAFLHYLPDWAPVSDNALLGLRAHDVGTTRTPLTGQPSFSGFYAGDDVHVDHPGPIHVYALAPFVRLLGASAGMLLVSVLASGAAALIIVWVVHRQLGARAAVGAAVVMALVMYTTGAAALANPLSSSFAGYPLLCSAVVVWAVLCGDDRLLPLAAGVVSVAGQMHLSVGPTVAVLVVTLVIGAGVVWWRAGARHRPEIRLRARRIAVRTGAVTLLLWAPPLVQQVFGRHPNISALVDYAGDAKVRTLGAEAAGQQLANALGWPPLLGRSHVSGLDIIARPSLVTWLSALAVVVLLALAGVAWRRGGSPARATGVGRATAATRITAITGMAGMPGITAHDGRRRSLLVVMVGVTALAGYLNGSRVPDGGEKGRLVFYHWVWPLTFFVTLSLLLLVLDLARVLGHRVADARVGARLRSVGGVVGRIGVGAAVAGVAALAVANVVVDRWSNRLEPMQASVPRQVYESLADQVAARRDDLTGPVLLTTRNQFLLAEHHAALAVQLEERGIPVVHPHRFLSYVADARLFDEDSVRTVLVLDVSRVPPASAGPPPGIDGEEIAGYQLFPAFDVQLYQDLVEELGGVRRLEMGPAWARSLAREDPVVRNVLVEFVEDLPGEAAEALLLPETVDLLLEHPPTNVTLDPELLEQHRANLTTHERGAQLVGRNRLFQMRVFAVTGDDVDELV